MCVGGVLLSLSFYFRSFSFFLPFGLKSALTHTHTWTTYTHIYTQWREQQSEQRWMSRLYAFIFGAFVVNSTIFEVFGQNGKFRRNWTCRNSRRNKRNDDADSGGGWGDDDDGGGACVIISVKRLLLQPLFIADTPTHFIETIICLGGEFTSQHNHPISAVLQKTDSKCTFQAVKRNFFLVSHQQMKVDGH